MKYELNDLAIIMANKIYNNLFRDFTSLFRDFTSLKVSFNQEADPSIPNAIPLTYYETRARILEVLEEYISILNVDEHIDPRLLADFSPKIAEQYKEESLKRKTCMAVEKVFEDRELSRNSNYTDAWGHYRSNRATIAFIKLGKIQKEDPQYKPY